jgi:hypothetical protein
MNVSGLNAAVVIPIYKPTFDRFESISLEQCLRVLGGHQIIFCAPESLDVETPSADTIILRFPDSNFSDIKGYNRLLLTRQFYAQFGSFDYILIHQLDSFVFRDDLLRWCSEGYDFIGAPWLGLVWPNSMRLRWRMPLRVLMRRLLLGEPDRSVGNGGFSLRKVSTFLSVLDRLGRWARDWPHNEDQFWSLLVPNMIPSFRIPSKQVALDFAFEVEPRRCYEMNDRNLPFGCHAWLRYDPVFWRPFVQQHGFDF